VVGYLRDGKVSIDVFALSAASGRGAEGPAVLRAAPLDPAVATVRRGESVRLDVVVRSRGVGHLFPGGKNDAVECWLELKAADADGRVFFWSGRSGPGEPVDPGAHFLRRRWIDGEGRPIERRDDWRARAELYNQTIQPNTADVVRYRLEIPADAGPAIAVEARLNYRQFAHPFDRWVRAGAAAPLPELPVVVIAADAVRLAVIDGAGEPPPGPGAAPPSGPTGPAHRERWTDYGIGLLLQGDLRGARDAFARVTELDPEWADGWLNLARATTNEGDVEATRAALGRAVALAPDLARVRYYQGRLAEALGDPAGALVHLRAAAAQYPADRLVRSQIGQLLLLAGDPAGAVAEMEAVLAVDPLNAGAHYNLMRAFRLLGDEARADRHLRLYERFRADQAAVALARAYLESHPDDNRERQAIHEHRSAPLAPATTAREAGRAAAAR
jgi:tetratricopeptide (TPR) repeat protein